MAYLALARQYRPQRFCDVVGQAFVVQALRNAVSNQRLHHAILLTGTRGIGKTTLARIVAKAINCLHSDQGEPCNQCAPCLAITQGQFADVLEIDAASRTKVEDTRELLSSVHYAPTHGRYKVYIIDEVHMLSGHSFNALLKTLEEPPAHVMFLLATTDPQRLPITVLSRCLQFHLHPLTETMIANHLADILKQQQIPAASEALAALARAAKGSLRDGLSLLDQALAATPDGLSSTTVQDMLGHLPSSELSELLNYIIVGNTKAALDWVDHCAEKNMDFNQLTDDLLDRLHHIARQQASQEDSASTDIQHAALSLSPETVQLYYEIVILNKKSLPFAASLAQGFAMLVIRLILFQPLPNQPIPLTPITPEQTMIPNMAINDLNRDWEQLSQTLPLTGICKNLINYCTLVFRSEQSWRLAIDPSHAAICTAQQQQRIRQAIQIANATPDLNIEFVHSDTPIACPAHCQQARLAERLKQAQQDIPQNPCITALMQEFNATIDERSIELLGS